MTRKKAHWLGGPKFERPLGMKRGWKKKAKKERRQRPTSRLVSETLANLAGLLEVDVPVLRLASLVLQGKSKDGLALLDGILPLGLVGVERVVDGVKGRRGGELVCR